MAGTKIVIFPKKNNADRKNNNVTSARITHPLRAPAWQQIIPSSNSRRSILQRIIAYRSPTTRRLLPSIQF
jgi:hypothetical protein